MWSEILVPETMRGGVTKAMAFELSLAQRAGIYPWGKDTLGKGNSLTKERGKEKNMADLRSTRSFVYTQSYNFTC